MKVGTITYHRANNYGAALQAYALQKTLDGLGFDSEIINYIPNQQMNTRKKSILNKVLTNVKNIDKYIAAKIFRNKFRMFREENLKISNKSFVGDATISEDLLKYDAYIVGSDQVWNTDISNKSKAYFLHFVHKGKKISYAGSLGKDTPNTIESEYIKKYLSEFKSISVREKKLKDILQEDYNIQAECVLDPVFLLNKEEWLKISKRVNTPKKYVLCYMLEYSDELINHTKELAKRFDAKALYISPSHSNFKGKKLYGLGPKEFLYVIANAQYICTNSFHGTAFSIIFEKNFTIFKHSKLNSRIENIVNLVGLNYRFYSNDAMDKECVDYNLVKKILGEEINRSKEFLLNSLGDDYKCGVEN